MDLQAKIIVTFVWGIIIFETAAYLSLYAPLLHSYAHPQLCRTQQSSTYSSHASW